MRSKSEYIVTYVSTITWASVSGSSDPPRFFTAFRMRPFRPPQLRLETFGADDDRSLISHLERNFTHCHVTRVQTKDVDLRVSLLTRLVQRLPQLGNRQRVQRGLILQEEVLGDAAAMAGENEQVIGAVRILVCLLSLVSMVLHRPLDEVAQGFHAAGALIDEPVGADAEFVERSFQSGRTPHPL